MLNNACNVRTPGWTAKNAAPQQRRPFTLRYAKNRIHNMKPIIVLLFSLCVGQAAYALYDCKTPDSDMEKLRCSMEARKGKLHAIYVKELKSVPGLSGEIIFRVSVSNSGEINSISMESSTFERSAMNSKMLNIIKGVTFMPLLKSKTFEYRYTFSPK